MKRFLVIALLGLSACGADGEPEPPATAPAPGVTISGTVEAGIVVRN